MKKPIPEHIRNNIVEVRDSDRVRHSASLEAMITFMKRRQDLGNSNRVYIEPRLASTKEDVFNYGRIFAQTLRDLEDGKLEVPQEFVEQFKFDGDNED